MAYVDINWDNNTSPRLFAKKVGVYEKSMRAGFRTPLLASRGILAKEIRTNFDVGGRPKWADLSPKTTAKKTRNKTRPLIHTGRLRTSASAKERWHVSNNEAVFGDLPVTVHYGWAHIEGTFNMPARNWLNVPGDTVDVIGREIFDPWLGAKRTAAGL